MTLPLNIYYHLSDKILPPGTVLESRFGVSAGERRIYDIIGSALKEGESVLKSVLLSNALNANVLPMYLKEIIFEQVRITQFPDRPPRLGGFSLCPTLDDIKKFQHAVFPERKYFYACEVKGGVNAILDLSLVAQSDVLLPIVDQLKILRERAIQYWSGNHSNNTILELVTTGKVTILQAETP
jgi:hypothetical protein